MLLQPVPSGICTGQRRQHWVKRGFLCNQRQLKQRQHFRALSPQSLCAVSVDKALCWWRSVAFVTQAVSSVQILLWDTTEPFAVSHVILRGAEQMGAWCACMLTLSVHLFDTGPSSGRNDVGTGWRYLHRHQEEWRCAQFCQPRCKERTNISTLLYKSLYAYEVSVNCGSACSRDTR